LGCIDPSKLVRMVGVPVLLGRFPANVVSGLFAEEILVSFDFRDFLRAAMKGCLVHFWVFIP